MKKAKNISEIKEVTSKKILSGMVEMTKNHAKEVENLHVYISSGNQKTGAIPSVSLRPILDCANCKACCKLCYDLRNDCCYPTVQNTRAKNAAIYAADPDRYFREISQACKLEVAFRWHIGGDIKDERYLLGMVQVAKENKHCKFLVFTKRFDLINNYLNEGKKIPRNLQVIFSGWKNQDMPNPHNLPTSHPIFADGSTSAHDGAKLCTGNCTECLLKGRNCWKLKKGEEVVFFAH